jgi:uncharacterized membrane protein
MQKLHCEKPEKKQEWQMKKKIGILYLTILVGFLLLIILVFCVVCFVCLLSEMSNEQIMLGIFVGAP